ncbi:hypothetical protein V6N11_067203 [Hibiscus sabdariffa]|uniref:Uncharacterized protein n=1 Tax=Hibiscus sabdariffa TaxID=183260 RepID=A0ABR2SQT6_9ROSI
MNQNPEVNVFDDITPAKVLLFLFLIQAQAIMFLTWSNSAYPKAQVQTPILKPFQVENVPASQIMNTRLNSGTSSPHVVAAQSGSGSTNIEDQMIYKICRFNAETKLCILVYTTINQNLSPFAFETGFCGVQFVAEQVFSSRNKSLGFPNMLLNLFLSFSGRIKTEKYHFPIINNHDIEPSFSSRPLVPSSLSFRESNSTSHSLILPDVYRGEHILGSSEWELYLGVFLWWFRASFCRDPCDRSSAIQVRLVLLLRAYP